MTIKENLIYTSDCLYVMYGLNSESIDLIYLDPPFNSKKLFKAPVGSKAAGASFEDMWSWDDVDEQHLEELVEGYPFLVQFIQSIGKLHSESMKAYITYMAQRIIQMHRILKKTGSIYLHCDPTASHYLKIIMDRIFGKKNFQNEISWCYTGPRKSPKKFGRKHDIILFYSKDNENKVFNEQRIQHKSGVHNTGQVFGSREEGTTDIKKQMEDKGKLLEDWWVDIWSTDRYRKELTGYPTQKPLKLLERIILASSNEGDVILDPFCGCATTCVSAQYLNRKWIGIDVSETSVNLVQDRLEDVYGLFNSFANPKILPVRTDIKKIKITKSIKETLFENQKNKCNACNTQFELRNLEVDHIVPKSKGGGDYIDNLQLLCGHCNRVKGNKPMAYLESKIKKINDMKKYKLSFNN